jgi:putative acetyltransferase
MTSRGRGAVFEENLEAAARKRGMVLLFVKASESARYLFERQGFHIDNRNDFSINNVPIHVIECQSGSSRMG